MSATDPIPPVGDGVVEVRDRGDDISGGDSPLLLRGDAESPPDHVAKSVQSVV